MPPILEAQARLTSQNQITIPAVIRKALGLRGGSSRIKFQVLPGDGTVVVARVDSPEKESKDPALGPFLRLLAADIKGHPQRIKPFPLELLKRVHSAVDGIDVDLDGPLTGED
jgi:AbrB family looped-hinge helix DNA binding protein